MVFSNFRREKDAKGLTPPFGNLLKITASLYGKPPKAEETRATS